MTDAEIAAKALDLMRADAFPFTEPVDRLAELLHRALFGCDHCQAAVSGRQQA